MMTKLREYSKVFIVIVALAFIGLMVFEWGMDYSGIRTQQNLVGVVNGQELSYQQFTELYQQAYQNERQRRDEQLNESQLENLRNQVWEQYIQRVIFQEEIDKLGITATDAEITYQIKNYPLDEFKNNPGFQTNGQFDWDKYHASFGNPEIPWIQIEDFYRQQLPFQKLQNVITSTVRVSDSEVEEEFRKNELKAKVSYLEIPFAAFRTKQITVPDEEIRAYYDDHIADYQREEKRDLAYVSFSLVPTATDTFRVMEEFKEIRNRLANGEDFNELADEYSEDPAKATNHGRYDYFERGAMVKPFEDASFNSKVGDLVGPVETQFGMHLIKIEDKRVEKGKPQAKVSHILLKVAAGPSTREKQENKAAFFAEDARNDGFEKVAETQEYEIKKTGLLPKKLDFVPGFGRNFSIASFVAKAQLGDVSDVIYTDDGFAVFKLNEIQDAGNRPFDEVKEQVRNKIIQDKQKELAREFAVNVKNMIESGKDFTGVVNADTAKIVRSDSTGNFAMLGSIPGIGFDHKFNASAFALSKGQVSEMIETSRGLYWEKLIQKTEFDSLRYTTQKEPIRNRLMVQKKNKVFTDWYEYLKEKAQIEDNRQMFNL